jgi:hypothetical protein
MWRGGLLEGLAWRASVDGTEFESDRRFAPQHKIRLPIKSHPVKTPARGSSSSRLLVAFTFGGRSRCRIEMHVTPSYWLSATAARLS